MTEIVAGTAIVLALIAVGGVLVLAHELGEVRAHRLQYQAHVGMDVGWPVVYRALSGEPALPTHDDRLVLFTRPSCRACEDLLRDIAASSTNVYDQLLLVVRASAEDAAAIAAFARISADRVLADEFGAMAAQFQVRGYPSAVFVTHGRRTQAAEPVFSLTELASLGGAATALRATTSAARVEPRAEPSASIDQ